MSCLAKTGRVVCVLLLTALSAPAQQPEYAGHHKDQIGWVPRTIMSQPLSLRKGIGNFHEPVTTSSAEAQAFYDQGEAYLHSYIWIEAARSFHQALRLDPKLAMAYLGLSYAYSSMDYPAAQAAAVHAAALAQKASDRERRRVGIRSLQLEAMLEPSNSDRLLAFRKAIDEALAVHPDDAELLLLRGNAEEPTPFGDGQGCVASAIPYYKRVLDLFPENFAAQHYLAHCYENTGQISAALVQAEAYTRLAPAIPHAHHMYGHELRRSGRVEEAITQFRQADELERAYYRRENVPAYLDWHHTHNLALLASCYQFLGQMKSAERFLREEISLPAFTDYAMLSRSNWPVFLLNRGRFSEALVEARAMQELPSRLAQTAGQALAGEAALGLHLHEEAKRNLVLAQEGLARLPGPDAAAVQSYVGALRAELLSATDEAGAAQQLRSVVKQIRASNNPDAWAQALFRLEAFARFARNNGDWEAAEELASEMIDQDLHFAGSHFAMALVAQHREDADLARSEFTAAQKLWSTADPDLPELAYIRDQFADPSRQALE